MKIICVGRNYAKHVKEMKGDIPTEPVIFLKPHSALIKNNMSFEIPSFSNHLEYEGEVVIRICRNGKNIHVDDAPKYYDGVTMGIDFTARDLQKQCKEKGLPWEIAKAFDHSAPVGKILPVNGQPDIANLDFELKRNGISVQKGNTSEMLFGYNQLIAYISRFFTLNIGDLLFTGTPEGVGKVEREDFFEGFLQGNKVFDCRIS